MKVLFKTSEGELRWGWKTILLLLGTILFGVLLSSLLIAISTVGYLSQGSAREQALEKATIAAGSFEAQVIVSVLQLAFMLWLVWWLVRKVEKQPFDWLQLGFLQGASRPRQLLLGALLAIVMSLSIIGIGLMAGTLEYLATATLVGVLFGLIFVRTGSLWMGIALHVVWNYLQLAVVAIRTGADERFFGAPLFVFDTISAMPHMLVEFGVIFIGLLLALWLTTPERKWIPASMS